MATKGRGGDSMLVHMTPGEVQALQTLAERNGGTLTINPETGQPEANFLKKILPMVAGFALGPAGFGLMSAGMAGAAVGGITALSTGSLSRGLMAGLGAYGGASLGAGLAGSGAGAAQEAAIAGLTKDQIAQQAVASGLTEQGVLNQAAADATKDFLAKGVGDRFMEGATAAFKDPKSFMTAMGGPAKAIGAGFAALSPMMAADTVQTTTRRPDTGYIRNFTFDPYGQTYSDAGSYPASEYKGMAEGGIVALAKGGVSDQDVQNWFATNTGATDAQIAAAMQQYNVAPEQVARVTGVGMPEVQQRFETAIAPQIVGQYTGGVEGPGGTTAVRGTGYLGIQDQLENVGVTAQELFNNPNYKGWSLPELEQAYNVANKIQQFDTGANSAALDDKAWAKFMDENKFTVRNIAQATGLSEAEVQRRYDAAKTTTKPPITTITPSIITGNTQGPGTQDSVNDLRNVGIDRLLPGVSGGGNTVVNANGTITTRPDFSLDMKTVRDRYTQGGGSLGYVNPAPRTMEEFNQRFNRQTGDSLAAYEYLMGEGANPIKSGVGEIMRPYSEAVRGIPAAEGRPTQKYIYQNGKYVENPNYRPLSYNTKGERMVGMTSSEVIKGLQGLKDPADNGALFDFVSSNRISEAQLAAALGISIAEARARLAAGKKIKGVTTTAQGDNYGGAGGDSGDDGPGDTGGTAGASGSDSGGGPGSGGAGGCVDPNVMVLLADGGHVRAGDLRVGDMLHTLHEDTFVYGNFPVEFVEIIQQPKVEAVFDNDQKIIVSTTHKFLTADGVWKQMRDLALGDVIRATGTDTKTLTGVTALGEGPVVKMTVTDAHTYIADGLVSHNKARGGIVRHMALGGLGALAGGGQAGYNLGGYSDGGRLLRGPGDGVSDSIPASIGRNRQPARLADGEFVVPARIVSELGNGSTEAGARKLYAMMDRVQKARGRTTGKRRVAANTRADKYLPA
jgi:hypothetical protein